MSQIWIGAPGSTPEGPHDEQAVRERSARGELPAGTQYWRAGMPAWRPLEELLARPPLPPPHSAQPPTSTYAAAPDAFGAALQPPAIAFARDPSGLTRWLVGLLWASAGVAALSLLQGLGELALLARPHTPSEAAASESLAAGLGLLLVVIAPATAVTFLRWIHRAGVNVRAFGATGLRTSPGWAVGWFFVPMLNLWKPYQAMKEIARASAAPRDWQTAATPSVLGWWWGFFLIDSWVSMSAFRAYIRADSLHEMQAATALSCVSSVTGVLSALAAIAMVKAVYSAQQATVQRGA